MAILPTSPKQDCGGVRTAADIERKYDLSAIAGMKQAIMQTENELTKTNAMLEEFVASTLGTLENMQSQIDGNITTWFDYGKPTSDIYPANEWLTDEMKINHIGDLYYDRNTGYAYRYETINDGYSWEKIKDNDVVEALAIANAAKDTADNKRRVFVQTPAPPYDSGDLWFTSDGEIYVCQISKDANQQYAEKDFIMATKYTDDTYAKQVGEELTVVRGTVTTILEGMDSFSVNIKTLQDELTLAQTTIKANTDEIELSVKKGGVIGAINVSDEDILIEAKRLNLTGAVTISALSDDVKTEIDTANTNANTAKTNASTALNRATYHYGTCSTAAATASKVVTLSGFSLYTGAQISVKFTYANTAPNPTLNVNSKGAKYIRVNNANIGSAYYWGAGDTVSFIYDGTYWVLADSAASSLLASWCYNNDKTIIDGGKLATGSVTAEKINVDDLSALNATIGGWNIGEVLSSQAQGYVAPGEYERDRVEKSILGEVTLTTAEKKYLDLNNDGNVNIKDLLLIQKGLLGVSKYEDNANAQKSTVNVEFSPTTPEKLIKMSATTPWGRQKEAYLGINELYFSSVRGDCVTGDVIETTSGVNLDTLNSNLTVLTDSRLSVANSSVSISKISTKKLHNIYIINVDFTVSVDIAAYAGIFKVTDDIATSALVLPIVALCWQDGSTAWFYQQYNNIMNKTKLLKDKTYIFSYAYIV